MLRDIDRHSSALFIAGRAYPVRFSLNALLCLETTYKPLKDILLTDFAEWSVGDVLQLCHAAMCSLPENRKAVDRRDFENVQPTLSELGEMISASDLPLLRAELIAAVIDSMPDPGDSRQEPPSKAFHEGHQRAIYVDVMHRPEREFWSSTNREIAGRIDCYLEVTGKKEAAEAVQEYDDDD